MKYYEIGQGTFVPLLHTPELKGKQVQSDMCHLFSRLCNLEKYMMNQPTLNFCGL